MSLLHICTFLVEKLNFGEYWKYIAKKVNKTIGLLRKLKTLLPRRLLDTIYKSYIRTHLNYRDILFDKAYNKSFHKKFYLRSISLFYVEITAV